ncbi:peptidoglycan recognition protein family protein [Streptomyces gobiensis]|uniref:peptidoglycan recognition protein family protein n=1 Tax=Streptomyces gobiensis TaxID=2875706 RepID=UPI001E395D58|nr:peptidoglycan recognition protein [Streptomyces gobiensis]UGY91778.1 peptidoglycan recognition protein [Streptomyces gobiensis]
MRAILASSIGVVCTAVLLAPLAAPAGAASGPAAGPGQDSGRPASTQSLPLTPLDADNATQRAGAASQDAADGSGTAGAELAARDVEPFSLVGVVWEGRADELHGQVQVRSRATGTAEWSGWQELEAHGDDAPDQDSDEHRGGTVRSGTAPMWVGDSDGVQVRVRPEAHEPAPLPRGLRVELVDPGSAPAGGADGKAGAAPPPELTPEESASSAVNAQLASIGAELIPPLSKEQTEADLVAAHDGRLADGTEEARGSQSRPYVGPRPGIVTRRGWRANEKLREKSFPYNKSLKAAFIHHTAMSNNYTCRQAPSIIRGIYRYHVKSLGWRDIGYNFLIDKCGTIYEGRAGGVTKAVRGAHTYGFNGSSMGIAVLGSYSSTRPTRASVNGVAKLTSWKLGLWGLNPIGSVTMVSGGGKYKKGSKVRMRAVSGHRDGFSTECPGAQLYSRLDTIRSTAARLQGR